MPKDGFYFDDIIRQPPLDEDNLNVDDNLEEFTLISDAELAFLEQQSHTMYENSDRAVVMALGGMAFGDVALVPGPMLKFPKGIRDITEWYMSTAMRSDFISEIYERQCEIALQNLPKIYKAVGERIQIAWLSGTDFGSQNNCLISPKAFRNLYKPFYKRLNDWIHENTGWKVFIHTCGSILPLIPDIIEAGFDILNPVQISAANMDPVVLKERFGDKIVFWGGGIDTQKVLPFGTPDEVRAQVAHTVRTFGKGGGYVFNPVHNVQANVPIENLLAMYETVRSEGKYV
jgi:uroporphyrinogen-III decarboxylase